VRAQSAVLIVVAGVPDTHPRVLVPHIP
jgi:hypothetical protein